jgi:hypothetical protein
MRLILTALAALIVVAAPAAAKAYDVRAGTRRVRLVRMANQAIAAGAR